MDNGYVDIVFKKETLTCTEQLKKIRKKLLSQKICLCSNAIQHKRILIRFLQAKKLLVCLHQMQCKKNHSRAATNYKSDTGNKAYTKMTKLNCNLFISLPMQHCPEVSGLQLIRIYRFLIYMIYSSLSPSKAKKPSFIDPHGSVYLSQYILCVY